ncbi:MAG: hypothetical protein M1812_005273 [Candelaria pacifica]|nr:MAG: hypothetical protein M1812_005273 [Candelaria pacifica]
MLPLFRWMAGTATGSYTSHDQRHRSRHTLTPTQIQWLDCYNAAKRIEDATELAEEQAAIDRGEDRPMRRPDPWIEVMPDFRRRFPDSPISGPRQLHDVYVHQMGLRPPPMSFEEARRAGYNVARGPYAPGTGSRREPTGSREAIGSTARSNGRARPGDGQVNVQRASELAGRGEGRSTHSSRR